jgi:hypothetical protein
MDILEALAGALQAVVDFILSILLAILTFLLDIVSIILPASPFSPVINGLFTSGAAQWFGWLNWFIPIPEFIVIFLAWLTCYGIYLGISYLVRWIKLIE